MPFAKLKGVVSFSTVLRDLEDSPCLFHWAWWVGLRWKQVPFLMIFPVWMFILHGQRIVWWWWFGVTCTTCLYDWSHFLPSSTPLEDRLSWASLHVASTVTETRVWPSKYYSLFIIQCVYAPISEETSLSPMPLGPTSPFYEAADIVQQKSFVFVIEVVGMHVQRIVALRLNSFRALGFSGQTLKTLSETGHRKLHIHKERNT